MDDRAPTRSLAEPPPDVTDALGPPGPGAAGALGRARRAPAVLRLCLVYVGFRLVELGTWVAVTIHAHRQGGVDEAGAVMVAELVPAVVVAALVGRAAARCGTRTVLVAGLATQAAAVTALAVAVTASGPWWAVYGPAVVASAAMVTTRPTLMASFPPTLGAAEITAVHSVLGWLDGLALLGGPALVAVALAAGGAASPFTALALLIGATALASRGLPAPGSAGAPVATEHLGFASATRALAGLGGAGAALAVLAGQALLVGTLDLLVVVAAVDVLGGSPALAGWLSAAFGLGALLGGVGGLLFVGREQLWPVVAGAGATAVASSALVGTSEALWLTAPAFMGCGLAVTLLVVTSRSIL